ncbi:MAG TPA: hypothetical protein VI915_00025 [Thermoplasmata archaeon]|nr:hypothetical protein [Thermoplasmata archaeon]
MDAEAEGGETIGRLRPGFRSVAGVVPDDVYEALVRLRESEGLTMSQAVGRVLTGWQRARHAPRAGLEPTEGARTTRETADPGRGLEPTETRTVAMGAWQEVVGIVRAVEASPAGLRIVLQDPVGSFAVALPGEPVGHDLLVPGTRVGILRTDRVGAEYVVRGA